MGVARAAFGVRMEREVKRLEESWQQLQQEWNKADLEKLHQAVYHLYRLSELNDCTPFSLALRNLEVYLYLLQRSESLPTKNQRLDVQASLTALKHAIITLAPPVEDNIHLYCPQESRHGCKVVKSLLKTRRNSSDERQT